jgi:hypothetical protein
MNQRRGRLVQARIDSKAAKKRLQGSQEKTPRQARKYSKAAPRQARKASQAGKKKNQMQVRQNSKVDKERLIQGRQEMTSRQARRDS